MSTLEPLINLLILLTVLSVAAERATNVIKLRREELRVPDPENKKKEKEREQGITFWAVVMGIGLAILVKADLFEIMTHLDSPWETLGWVRVTESEWSRVPATNNVGTALYALGGSAITGVALGFGSKFWHECLDIVFEVRNRAKALREKAAKGSAGGAGAGGGGHA